MEGVYDISIFKPELSLIVDPLIRELTERVLTEMPAYIWSAVSSVTNKYHPPEDNQPGGVLLHLKKTSWVAYRIFDNLGLNTDIGVSAGLTHDIALRGLEAEASDEFEVYEQHGELAYERLHEHVIHLADMPDRIVTDWNTICNCVRSHMGQWGKEKPTSPEEVALHCADVAASTRGLAGIPFIREELSYGMTVENVPDMSIEEIVGRKEFFITAEDGCRVFNFGKLEGRALADVASSSQGSGYLRWMIGQGVKSANNEKGFPVYVLAEVRAAILEARKPKNPDLIDLMKEEL